MENYRDEFLRYVDAEKLLGQTIKKDGSNYQIVASQKKDGALYLAFVCYDFYCRVYGEAFTQMQANQMQKYDVSNVYDFYDTFDLHADIVKINNCMLMRRDADQPVEEADFEVVSPEPTELFACREIYHNSNNQFDVSGDPFVVDGKPVAKYNQINFLTEERQLRKLLAGAMPDYVADLYKQQFQNLCFNKVISANDAYYFDKIDNLQNQIENLQKIAKNKQLSIDAQQQAKEQIETCRANIEYCKKCRKQVTQTVEHNKLNDNLEM